jgi:hypothetical protein
MAVDQILGLPVGASHEEDEDESHSDRKEALRDAYEDWSEQIGYAKSDHEKYVERGEKVIRRYEDERSHSMYSARMNTLWSNTELLRPLLYSRRPVPQVDRRFRDKDPVARVASMLLERALEWNIDEPGAYDFDGVIRSCVGDVLLPGRGQAWVSYLPYVVEGELRGERAVCEHVHWKDFLHEPARSWEEVNWVSRCTYLSRKELKERFGETFQTVGDTEKDVPIGYRPRGVEDDDPRIQKGGKARVWEIWCRKKREVVWIAEGYRYALDQIDDPLSLRGFFPCPKPLLATLSPNSAIPINDYYLYQDQAIELDDLTMRIRLLTQALRVVGVYDASTPSLRNLLSTARENEMVPVESWTMFAERGGLRSSVDYFPIDQVANVLIRLYEAREQSKQTLYEVTGISDLLRGSTKASETATAQRIKGHFGSLRMQERPKDVERFCRDIVRLQADIISHFQPQSLAMMGGAMQMQELSRGGQGFDTGLLMAAIELLRSPENGMRIDVETDSTVAVDDEQQKREAMEFVSAAGDYLQKVAPLVAQFPLMAPIATNLMLFGVRRFKASRQIESVFEEAAERIEESANQQAQMAQMAGQGPPGGGIPGGGMPGQAMAPPAQEAIQAQMGQALMAGGV